MNIRGEFECLLIQIYNIIMNAVILKNSVYMYMPKTRFLLAKNELSGIMRFLVYIPLKMG